MRATGIVRRSDDLGRVVIPKEIRRNMAIKEGDPLEIYTTNDGFVCFKKYMEHINRFVDRCEPILKAAKDEDIFITLYDADVRLTPSRTMPDTTLEAAEKNLHLHTIGTFDGKTYFAVAGGVTPDNKVLHMYLRILYQIAKAELGDN